MANQSTAGLAVALVNGTLTWATDDIRILLTDSTNALTSESLTLAAATLGEIGGTGYTRLPLLGKNTDTAGAAGVVRFTAQSVQWGIINPGVDITRAIVYKHNVSGLDADHVPLAIVELGTVTVASDTFEIIWPATGVTYVNYGAV